MKRISGIISLLLIIVSIYYSFYSLMPQSGTPATIAENEFSTERALVPLKEITQKPHFHGSEEHTRVRNYLVQELKNLGMETQVQDGFVLNQARRAMDKPKNILGRIKGSGSGKALMLLSHYDSAKTPSFGASDAGSGVVTILESLRAYLSEGKTPKNDIIVLFSDAEEIGLDGAKLFVRNHAWSKDIGLVLNFEARGSGGPSNMILETNQGNANLVKGFVAANPDFPVASSLMYSIYKMLPNDTDSTVFREEGDIDSFFFAFIDDHYDYHTSNDNYENLDRNTLQHQGTYLLPLLHYFTEADLSQLKAEEDYVYVNFPFAKMITYPFSWVIGMLIIGIIGFVLLFIYGIKTRKLESASVGKGFVAFLIPLVASGLIGFLGWKLLLILYPQYTEIQHGFTYNGHWYIAFFVFVSIALCFLFYRTFKSSRHVASFYVAPLVFWLIINAAVAIYLKGAAYYIIPFYVGLLSFWLLLRQEKPNLILLTLLAVPALFFFSPLIQFFPVGLGLKMLVISCSFTVLVFGLVLPAIGFYSWKKFLMLGSFLVAMICFGIAHNKSGFSETRQKPNSLIYYLNKDTNSAHWVTYDGALDAWTKGYLGDTPEKASLYVPSASGSKYNTGYTFATKAPMKDIQSFEVILDTDTIVNQNREINFTIIPKRDVHELVLYANPSLEFSNLAFNGMSVSKDTTNNGFYDRPSNRLLKYAVAQNDSLQVQMTTPLASDLTFKVLEYSFDLLSHPLFTINQRPAATMPKPFVNTDAIVTERSFNINEMKKRMIDTISQIPIVNE